ncbi:unnamed protein product, partial [marine sediment metagenome]
FAKKTPYSEFGAPAGQAGILIDGNPLATWYRGLAKDLIEIKIYEEKTNLYSILIEKALEKLYELLKNQNLLPDEPNIKVLWAEQLRKIKFEDWVEKNF